MYFTDIRWGSNTLVIVANDDNEGCMSLHNSKSEAPT